MAHARNAKLFTEIYLTLTGQNPKMVNQPKRGSKQTASFQSTFPMPDSGNNSTIQSATPPNQDASGVKSEGKVSPVSSDSPV
jgi:hypothetical protein